MDSTMDYKNIITDEDLKSALTTYFGTSNYEVISNDLGKASDELIGFLGEYLRMKVKVKIEGRIEEVPLFIKMVPINNDAQANYITNNNFYEKERTMYKLLNDVPGHEEPSPWKVLALHMTERVFIMEDMSIRGFKWCDKRRTMTLEECYSVISVLAKFHATTYKYIRDKSNGKLDVEKEYPIFMSPNNFSMDANQRPLVLCGGRSLVNYVGEVSKKYGRNSTHFEEVKEIIPQLYEDACKLIEKSDKYLNVFVHTDLWASNFLMRSKDVILLDFQCVKYAPGTVDLAAFLHLCADRELRDGNEEEFLRFYMDKFNKEANECDNPKEILLWEEIKESYERSRLFGYVISTMLFPYILLKSEIADKLYNRNDTYDKYNKVDRSEPMIATAKDDEYFGKRMLNITEEFIERCVINKKK